MNQQHSHFNNKKITVMGLGLLGRGVGDIRFLAEEGADLIVTDLKKAEDLQESLDELKKSLGEKKFGDIKLVLGEHRLEDFRDRNFILKAAGVPLDSIYIAEARKNGIKIEMSSALFASLTPATVIGITGTRGKSTVTHLIYSILLEAFNTPTADGHPSLKKEGIRIFLGGNVKGVATLPFLREAKKGDIAVLELDSWQLQGFGENKISPHISVFTNFMSDHLNYYKNNIEQYFADKANIFLYQKQNDYLVTGPKVAHLITAKYFGKLANEPIAMTADAVPKDWQIKIPGEHNVQNIALAIKVANIIGVPYETTKKAVEEFSSVSGRLELIREYKGVKIYNDTTATTPDATTVALKALSKEGGSKKTVLIMGGADKNLDMSELVKAIPDFAKAVILLPGTGTDTLEPELEKIKNKDLKIKKANSLQDAVTLVFGFAEKGDSVVLSPAFASFGMFKNEFDRGEQFNELIKNLK